MSWVAAAVAGSAVLGSATSMIGSKKAADATKDAAAISTAEQRRQYDTTRADFAPYRDVGGSALSVLADIYGLPRPDAAPASTYQYGGAGGSSGGSGGIGGMLKSTIGGALFGGHTKTKNRPIAAADLAGEMALVRANPDAYDEPHEFESYIARQRPGAQAQFANELQRQGLSVFAKKADPWADRPVDRYGGFYESPNYQFRLGQGLNAVQRSAAARGRLFSGAAVKAVNDYAQGTASDEWANWVNGLKGMAGVGQSATGSTAAAGTNAANVISQTAMTSGAQRASSYMAGAEGVNNAVQGGLGNWIFYNAAKNSQLKGVV